MAKKKEVKKEPTPEMLKYIEAKQKEKEALEEQEKLRPILLNQFKESFPGEKWEWISYREQVRNPMDETEFFLWVQETWPGVVDSLRKDEICPIKFEKAQLKGLIDYDEIPDRCYTEKRSDVITVTKKG